MKKQWLDIAGGMGLILVGCIFLAQNLGYLPKIAPLAWAIMFGVASAGFFVNYGVRKERMWWWLFPAVLTAVVALLFLLAAANIIGAFMGTLVLWGCAIPFLVAFWQDKQQNWWGLIPFWVLLMIGSVLLLAEMLPGEWVGGMILLGLALPFLAVYLGNRRHWWALIPAYVLVALSLLTLFGSRARSEVVGAYFMFALALPFVVLFMWRRAYQWALIPAYVLTVLGIVVGFGSNVRGEYVGAFFMFAVALLFGVIYWRYPENWWAQIPAGIFASVGVTVLVGTAVHIRGFMSLPGFVLFAGITLTFGVLWLQRHRYPVEWAKYPAGGFALGALLMLVLGSRPELISAISFIAIGLWLLYENHRALKLKG